MKVTRSGRGEMAKIHIKLELSNFLPAAERAGQGVMHFFFSSFLFFQVPNFQR